MKVILTAAARAEVTGIGDWIAQDNPRRAVSFVNELDAACDALAEMPQRFQLLTGHEQTGIRRRPYGNYLIFYWIKDEQTVEILHVLHGARDWEQLLFPDDAE